MVPSMAPISSGDDQDQVLEQEQLKCLRTIADATVEEQEISSTPLPPLRCPGWWDGILCWGEADPGEMAVLPCPNYVAGFDASANATRQCMENGQWQQNPDNPDATWTNFSQCYPNFITTILVPFSPLEANSSFNQWIPVVKTMSKVGYSVSLITLVVAFTIMASIKKLRCPRNMLHMHLFASFIMRAFMSLLKDQLFIDGVDVSSNAFVHSPEGTYLVGEQRSWECKLVISLWEFFLMANYSWVLMEGLYLHNLIFLALFSDTSAITLYVIIGWGLPVLVVVPWVALRAVLENTLCWTTHENWWFFLVIHVPTTATVLINFLLFVNIVRVLLLKLRSSICEETRKYRYRRWAKSTLVLVPLFGIHYTLLLGMYFASVNHVVEIIWLFCDQFFASFQGCFVAILYCFMNGEVRAEVAKIWLHHFSKGAGADGKAQWWLSSGYADGGSSSRRTSRAILSSFPRKSRDLGKKDTTINAKTLGNQVPSAHRFSKSGDSIAIRQSPPPVGGSSPRGGGVPAPSSCWKDRGGCRNLRGPEATGETVA
ncbi:parathyroid hormone/parathyroid hormone-related peptide receptor-like [Ischnura elegans]|uniref:parathyroid hormone/parathyroid hormone-related peptide receptor-like n=1 Tax=Ischnura elegans TaxID=197161 RepID=UPI001ED8A553|nr:parathyroid hormone/parathyroid hormone-related peptide receptor-like [Ischnura elegans]